MTFLSPREETAPRPRDSWMPDMGVLLYVQDKMQEDFRRDVDAMPEHWMPLAIVGTLDWVVLSGWWLFRNTGIFQSDAPYRYVFDYDGYEFDPDQLLVFSEDKERNQLIRRLSNPGIDRKERTEALPFLATDIFTSWLKGEHDMSEEEAAEFIPPEWILEEIMYATFMWILDEYGEDWIYMQDEMLACVLEHKVAYVSLWDNTLLDPNIMMCTNRPLNSCRYCNEELHCVMGSEVDKLWQFVCNSCLVTMALESHHHLDNREERLQKPRCPNIEGVDGTMGNCKSVCPHSGTTEETQWEKMEAAGRQRVDSYREHIESIGGINPRQLAGQSVRSVVDHFNGVQISARDVRRLRYDEED